MGKYVVERIDKRTLLLLIQGDESAFESIYRTYSAWVYNFFLSILSDEPAAEDLTQNVFLKIWEKRADIDPDAHFEAYLFTIARHLAYRVRGDYLTTESLTASLQDRQEDVDISTEQEIEAVSLREYIDSLVEQLPPARREIYRLSRIHHLSNKEIAERLSISVKTVETQLYRSLQFLKAKLSDMC
jgi:RNA polymerase sigma-70 factor (ECF subfamily)